MATVELERFVHPELGFGIDLPAGLLRRTDLPGTALAAWEPGGASASGFTPNVTVVAERLAGGIDLVEYAERSLAEQARVLAAWHLIDREDTSVGGIPALRTLGHHTDGAFAVVAEQWRLVDGDLAWVVTGSSEALDYALAAETWRLCAESFRPREQRR